MKKVLLTLVAALLIVSAPASAQQRKTVKKATKTAKRTTPRKKPVSQPVTIQMDEPMNTRDSNFAPDLAMRQHTAYVIGISTIKVL